MDPRTPEKDSPECRELPEPAEWLDRYGDELYRYALSRLRRPHDAEEAVQEALLAALRARGDFQGRSHPRTWLLGILRHKVLSLLRARARRGPSADVDDLDAFFDAHGHWRKPTVRWGDPAAAAERDDFWEVVDSCLGQLPARMAAAFALRTLDDQPPDAVCAELAISPANFWVLLHRARLRLVRCLQLHWFDAEEKPCSAAGK
jgi:RNA polymerase sigma-70 factor (ECF subfamily)